MLAANELRFSYPGRQVLEGVSLSVEPGTRTAIIGPNGSGKSTLLRLLGGLLEPEGGSVTLGDEPVHRLPPAKRARQLAYVPQATSLAFPFSVSRFVAFGRHALGSARLDEDVRRALKRVDLDDRAEDPLGELSQGQQQRASFARALCQIEGMPEGDRVLLADEPTASLDPRHHLRVLAITAELATEGVAVVAAVHDLVAAAAFDRVLLLDASGRQVARGRPGEVLTPDLLRRAFGVGFDQIVSDDGRVVALLPVEIWS
jgi:iron complex transport system ATP-binding protein